MPAEVGGTQSVDRALSLLRVFVGGRAELRLSDVARLAGLGTSTTSRLLSTLEGAGFVDRDPITGLYRLGLELVSLGGSALNHHPVHREARPVAQQLAAVHGLGANVAVRRGASLFYLMNFEGGSITRSYVLSGQRKPLHATALGKSLLCSLTPDERRELLPGAALVPYTPNTVTDHGRLDAEVDLVLARGYAVEREELAHGRACLAAPVREATGTIVAAISVSGPLSAIDLVDREAGLARAVVEAADSISVGLGYVGPPVLVGAVR